MPSSRVGEAVSLAGSALVLSGFFLPMFTESNPQVPGSAHAVYEWQVTVFPGQGDTLIRFFAALPLLGALIVLAISGAAFMRVISPKLVRLKAIVVAWGLAIQLLLDMFVFQISLIGYGHIDIALGFVILLVGLTLMLVGTHPSRTIFTPFTCMLFATGSVILGLGALAYGSLFPMILIVFVLLPLLFVISTFALLITNQWETVALILPLVIVALYTPYLFMALIIPIAIPYVSVAIFIALLILLNCGVFWLTRNTDQIKHASTNT